MKEAWISLEDRKPKNGETVLAFYYDVDFDIEQFEVMTYHQKGSVVGAKMQVGEGVEVLLKNLLHAEEIIAEEEGFYFGQYDAGGSIEFKKHADIVTHWQPLVAPSR